MNNNQKKYLWIAHEELTRLLLKDKFPEINNETLFSTRTELSEFSMTNNSAISRILAGEISLSPKKAECIKQAITKKFEHQPDFVSQILDLYSKILLAGEPRRIEATPMRAAANEILLNHGFSREEIAKLSDPKMVKAVFDYMAAVSIIDPSGIRRTILDSISSPAVILALHTLK